MKKSERMDYNGVYQVFDTLHFVFGAGEEEEIDDRCHALWILFLASVNWTEEEFWKEWDNHHEDDVCPDCGEKIVHEPSTDKKNQN